MAELGSPQIAAHHGQPAMPAVAHDLLVGDVVAIGGGDEPRSEPVWRDRLQTGALHPGSLACLSTISRTALPLRAAALGVPCRVMARNTGLPSMAATISQACSARSGQVTSTLPHAPIRAPSASASVLERGVSSSRLRSFQVMCSTSMAHSSERCRAPAKSSEGGQGRAGLRDRRRRSRPASGPPRHIARFQRSLVSRQMLKRRHLASFVR